MEITERVQVVIEREGFRDALYFTKEQRASLSDAEIAAAAKARWDAHVERLAAPVVMVEPEPEAKEAELASLTVERERLEARIAVLAVDPDVVAIKLERARLEAEPVKGETVVVRK